MDGGEFARLAEFMTPDCAYDVTARTSTSRTFTPSGLLFRPTQPRPAA